jgi:hypothetical protein
MSVFTPKPVSLSMKRLTSAILVFWVLFILVFSGLEPASSASTPKGYPANPMPAHTGGFGEKSCHTCHSDFELNPAGGALQIGWEPAAVEPGKEHSIRITLTHPDMLRAGFQLSARFADAPDSGKQAGHFLPSQTYHAMSDQEGISYLSQSLQGSLLTKPGEVDWTATWVAPPGKRRVVFHVSAVGGDEDGSAYGDWVYVSEFRPPLN